MIFPYFLGSISSLNSQPRKLAATCYAMNTAPDFPLIGKVRSYEWHFANTLCILQLSAFTALPVQLCSTACFSVCKQRGQFLRGLTRQVEPFYSAFGLSWSANSKILFKKYYENYIKILKYRFKQNKTPILVYCCLFEVMWLYQLTVPKVNLPPKKKFYRLEVAPGWLQKQTAARTALRIKSKTATIWNQQRFGAKVTPGFNGRARFPLQLRGPRFGHLDTCGLVNMSCLRWKH